MGIINIPQKGQMASQEELRTWEKTFDAIDDWICIIDLDGKIIRSNRTVEKFFGLTVQETIGIKCCKLLHGTDHQIEGCPLPEMETNQKRACIEVEVQNNRWMLVTVDPIFNPDKNMIGVVHIARDITHRIKVQNEREILVGELKGALDHINTLSGLIPICSNCKKIRDDKGYWNRIESYIESHTQASFSHGMCPECSQKLYGDQDWYIQMKKDKGKK